MTEPAPNTGLNNTPPSEPPKDEAKFTQADLDKVVQDRLKSEKTKYEKVIADKEAEAKKQAELAQMTELDRIKAEKEDFVTKYQAEADKNALSIQKDETRKLMSEKALPDVFLESVLVAKDQESTKSRINKVKAVFDEAVKTAIEKQLKTHVPSSGGVNSSQSGINKDVAQKPWNRFKQ